MSSIAETEKTAASVGESNYRWYALSLLFVVYVVNFIDRSILAMLSESIKKDLGASDTLMGLLGGPAFAIFYTFVGIPVARWADRSSRRNILAMSLTVWSVATAACGFVANFWHLLIARVFVAVGEAGGSPPSHSMISDYFPASQRATALAIYALGIPVGSMLGGAMGGWLNDAFHWRTAFIVVGLPGVVLAAIVMLALKEPRRGAMEAQPSTPVGEQPSVKEAFKYLWARKSFRYMSLAGAIHAFMGYGIGFWVPAFFIRIHEITTLELAAWAIPLGIPGIVGTFLGGFIGDWVAQRDVRWYLWLPGIATILSVPFALFIYTTDYYVAALLVSIFTGFFGAFYLGPTFALTQGLVGLRMRALASSILLFVLNLIGMGLGPLLTGMLSDHFHDNLGWGVESLRWALVAVSTLGVVGAFLYLLAARYIKDDLARTVL